MSKSEDLPFGKKIQNEYKLQEVLRIQSLTGFVSDSRILKLNVTKSNFKCESEKEIKERKAQIFKIAPK